MKEIFCARRDQLRRALEKRGLDAVLVRYSANRYYLSGFELHDVQMNESAGSLIIARDGRDFLLTDPRYEEAAKEKMGAESIVIYSREQVKCIARTLLRVGTRIGIEWGAVSAAFARELASQAPALSFEPCDGLIEELRSRKDASEQEALRASFALNHAMLAWLEGELAPGLTEAEVSWKIERYFREHGAQELAFPSIVAVGINTARPHAIPGDKRIEENSLVLIDVGCRVQEYCSDQTRTFWVGGKPSPRFSEMLLLVQEAQAKAIEKIRPGVALKDVDAEARAVFARRGVESHFTHSLGHGVGLETHERPSVSPSSEGTLKSGMVVTVEPGLYYPERGGIRWEHTVVVTEDGASVL